MNAIIFILGFYLFNKTHSKCERIYNNRLRSSKVKCPFRNNYDYWLILHIFNFKMLKLNYYVNISFVVCYTSINNNYLYLN